MTIFGYSHNPPPHRECHVHLLLAGVTSKDRLKSVTYQGSKIAKRLQSAKVLVIWDPLSILLLKKSLTTLKKKTEKGDPLVSSGILGYAQKNFLVQCPGSTGTF